MSGETQQPDNESEGDGRAWTPPPPPHETPETLGDRYSSNLSQRPTPLAALDDLDAEDRAGHEVHVGGEGASARGHSRGAPARATRKSVSKTPPRLCQSLKNSESTQYLTGGLGSTAYLGFANSLSLSLSTFTDS